jgi:hypothetical protein
MHEVLSFRRITHSFAEWAPTVGYQILISETTLGPLVLY